ncbi:MAG: tetratricopeptide repeat protein [Planctomycetaceae bacterium]
MSTTAQLFRQAVQAHQAGRLDEAEILYRNILQTDPRHHGAWHLLGVAAYQTQKPREAVEHIGTAIGLCHTEATYHRHLAAAYVALEDWQAARQSLEAVNRLIPGQFESCLQLGQVLTRLQSWDEAAFFLGQAVKLAPRNAAAWHELGLVCEHQGRRDDARAALKQSLQFAPSNPAVWNQLGTLWQEQGQLVEALTCYRSALEIDPRFAAAWANCGSIYQLQGDAREAANCYARALKIDPHHLNAWNNRGVILKDRGEFDEALECFEKCLTIQPDHADAHFNRSLLKLQQGDFHNGWEEYSWRWRMPTFGRPPTNFPSWGGPATNAAHVWLFAEQGLGDEIQFAGCFADLVERRIKCTIECDSRLQPLFERSFPSLTFVSRPAEAQAISRFPSETVQAPIGDLPKWFRTDEPSFPRHAGYLIADTALREPWRSRVRTGGEAKLNVGMSWQGGKDPIARRQRSTSLSDWEPLFQQAEIEWWNLQHGSCRDEWNEFRDIRRLNSLRPTPDFDPLQEQEPLAALIAELDLIISIDNAVVHLAGALGRPAWVLLPAVADWRWQLDRDDSLWYPSLKLFRQKSPQNWADVFREVALLLDRRSASKG